MKLKNRVAIITGANRGLGETIAGAFAAEGAGLLLVARTGGLLEEVATKLPRPAGQQIVTMTGDVANPAEVAAIRDKALAEFGRVDILVNNAGVYGPIGPFEENDWQEWCDAVSVNLYGTVLMCRAIVPLMKQQGGGKIICLSGGGATAPLPRFSAYAASKAAVVRFAETIAEELASYQIDVNAIAPGALNTRLLDQVLEAGPELVGENMYHRSLKQRDEGGVPLEKGADLAVFLASAESDGLTGRLLSAIWDNWAALPGELERVRSGDVFTLRRIVPKDRGWEF